LPTGGVKRFLEENSPTRRGKGQNMVNTQKKEQVKKIADSINKNKNFVLVKYEAISTKTFDDLKNKLKKVNSSVTVVKNTLFEKTVNLLSKDNKKIDDLRSGFFPLKDPTAIVYLGENWSEPLKIFYEFAKDIKNLNFKLGILDKTIYDDKQLLKISRLPTKEQLIAKIIGSFKSPTQKLVYASKFNMNKFVYILKQKSKEGGENNV